MQPEVYTILIADDEERIRKVLKINLKSKYRILLAADGYSAMEYLKNETVHLLLTDLKMPGMGGMALLDFVQKNYTQTPVILITAHGTIENAVSAMKAGAYDYVLKPVNLTELEHLIQRALQFANLLSENKHLKTRLKRYEGFREIITVDSQMQKLIETIRQVAASPATVLVEGESGTGKQLVAASIHYMSPRADQPFIEINCGAIPANLLESELFGHEKGAFTGAVQSKKGKFELADNGTLFLDEIGELPLELQVKLLHVLENQRFTRVGGTSFIQTHARIVAATNRHLQDEVEMGKFRQDLYYRLKVIYLHIPPLRERAGDIPFLAKHLIEKHAALNIHKKGHISISDEAMQILRSYTWPGNVRELENIIQQAIIFATNAAITADLLPDELKEKSEILPTTKKSLQAAKVQKTADIIYRLEYGFLKNILLKSKGNITHAAEISGYERRQIQNMIKKYHINTENYK